VFGCSIGHKIRQMRIEQIQKLLATTEDSISQIAQRMGFSDDSHISRFFKKNMRISPIRYRQLYCKIRSPGSAEG